MAEPAESELAFVPAAVTVSAAETMRLLAALGPVATLGRLAVGASNLAPLIGKGPSLRRSAGFDGSVSNNAPALLGAVAGLVAA